MGLFISFEGIDGTGKTYLLEKLFNYLTDNNIPVIKTREPGGTPFGEMIREILLQHKLSEKGKELHKIFDYENINSRTEALLFAASRSEHISEVIEPALEDGVIVLCDRFIDSSLAYQGGARGLGREQILDLNLWAVDGIEPDITFLITSNKSHNLDNLSESEPDRIEKEGKDFQIEVSKNYKEIAKEDPERVIIIDNTKMNNDAFEKILESVKKFI